MDFDPESLELLLRDRRRQRRVPEAVKEKPDKARPAGVTILGRCGAQYILAIAAGSGVCPASASELATALRRGHASVFHAAGEGQKGIELERWWSANTTARARTDGSSPPKREQAAADGAADDVAAPYPLPSSLPFGFEPFYAFSKAAGVPAFDESFRGLGFNRISQARAHATC